MSPTDRSVDLAQLAQLIATVLVGLAAGFFSTYQVSVTRGLAEVGDIAYVEAFQAINDTIRNPAFGIVFFGSIPAMLLAASLAWKDAAPSARILLGAAPVLYLSALVVTATGNVPLNDDLGEVEEVTAAAAEEARAAFEDDWNRLNLIRTLAVGASFVALAAVPLVTTAAKRSAETSAMEHNR